eukprot:CAMPEP_0202470774 /NCGR_PEP_ID=MMETSP1360-20130828/82538_1 /ASSEMBLY_ACC=CAM_ASM_000848 /TAXON_ID=515479 /ORGANISM="Licmophora paradoxa, Strain CCMP2313" /LENGTH=91 /DNA_ID=CAMNT_0049096591 /DNA_START=121 /DNA_END=392 /DNA_ORIENTATION=+
MAIRDTHGKSTRWQSCRSGFYAILGSGSSLNPTMAVFASTTHAATWMGIVAVFLQLRLLFVIFADPRTVTEAAADRCQSFTIELLQLLALA